MASLTLAALADDLTGAAEIAAIGKRYGLSTRIFTSTATPSIHAGLAVHDSDSRLLTAEEASLRITRLSSYLLVQKPGFIFKKTDSVLRGNIVAEVIALARALNLRRVLLIPANPALGRTITQGQYFVHGVPIDQTAFSNDPHHPAKSAQVADLLGSVPDWPVSIIKPGNPLPDCGIVVGEVATSSDIESWAKRLDRATLAAGGAEFFQACLKQQGFTPTSSNQPSPEGATLVVTGSLTPARQKLLEHAQNAHWPTLPMSGELAGENFEADKFSRWIEQIAQSLTAQKLALTESPRVALDDHATAHRIRRGFGQMVHQLLAKNAIGHLVVEGGATAAAISEAVDWTSFNVAGEWAPGVIALHPINAPQILFTIKPGSYHWPENLWRQLDTHRLPNAHS